MASWFHAAVKGVGDGAKLVARKYDELPTWGKVGVAGAAAGAAFYISLPAAGSVAMMKAPGAGGLLISRAAFVANPQGYFSLLRTAGAAAACAIYGGAVIV